MKRKILYQFDGDDPLFNRDIEHAFNRVANFCPEIYHFNKEHPKELKSFNRITQGEFSAEDLFDLNNYALKIHKIILEKYPSKDTELAESIIQAAENLITTMENFSGYFDDFIDTCIIQDSKNEMTVVLKDIKL